MIFALALFFLSIGLANVLFWPRVTAGERSDQGGVAVCIPARNEEGNLGDCLSSVLAQGENVTEVWVYDDHSTDRTAAIAASTGDARVRLVESCRSPAGLVRQDFCVRGDGESRRVPVDPFLRCRRPLITPGLCAYVVRSASAAVDLLILLAAL